MPRLGDGAGFRPPDRSGILRDRAIARELPGPCDVEDGLAAPPLTILVEFGYARLRRGVGGEVGQVHVVVAPVEQHLPDRPVPPRLPPAEMAREDQVEGPSGLVVVLVVPAGVVPPPRVGDLLGGQAEE